jgi:TolA-binding protein
MSDDRPIDSRWIDGGGPAADPADVELAGLMRHASDALRVGEPALRRLEALGPPDLEMPGRPRWAAWRPALAVLGLLLLVAAGVVLRGRGGRQGRTLMAGAGERRSLAVPSGPRHLVLDGPGEAVLSGGRLVLRSGRVSVELESALTIETPDGELLASPGSQLQVEVTSSVACFAVLDGQVTLTRRSGPVIQLGPRSALGPDGVTRALSAERQLQVARALQGVGLPEAPGCGQPEARTAVSVPQRAITSGPARPVAPAAPAEPEAPPSAEPTPPAAAEPTPPAAAEPPSPPPAAAAAAPSPAPSRRASRPRTVERPAEIESPTPTPTERPSPTAVEPPARPQPAPAPGPAPASALAMEARLLGSALRALRAQDGRGALAVLDEHARRFPSGQLAPEAQLARIDALVLLARRAEALTLLERLPLQRLGRGRELRVLRGELLARQGQCARALPDFAAALTGKDDRLEARALYGRASCLARTGDEAGARRDLERYLQRFPGGEHAAAARRALGPALP